MHNNVRYCNYSEDMEHLLATRSFNKELGVVFLAILCHKWRTVFCHTIFTLQVTFTNKIQILKIKLSKLSSGINLLTLDDTILG